MGVMSYETLENTVRRAFAFADGSISFAFQGGEPTLAGADFYTEFLELERKYNSRGIRVQNTIQTNGLALDGQIMDVFRKGNFLVGVSFDGMPELHNKLRLSADRGPTADKVEKTFSALSHRGIDFNVLCVVNKYVAENAEACFRYLAKYKYIQYIACLNPFDGKARSWSLTPELYANFLIKSFDLYYTAFKSGNYVSVRNFDNYIGILLGREPENCAMCGRCGQYFLIEADGSVYPCDFYVLDEWKIGNINNSSFFRLAKADTVQRFIGTSLYVSPECKGCKWYGLCRGGCRRDREPFQNDLPALNKWCISYKKLFEYAYPRMCEMARILSRDKV